MKTLIFVIVVILIVTIYARLSPVRATAKHDQPLVDADTDCEGGFTAVRPIYSDPNAILARLTDIALQTPRTTKLSDTPLRFVTRSRLMNFPDITTVAVRENALVLHGHLTMGRNDMGVNQARILDWLDRLGPL